MAPNASDFRCKLWAGTSDPVSLILKVRRPFTLRAQRQSTFLPTARKWLRWLGYLRTRVSQRLTVVNDPNFDRSSDGQQLRGSSPDYWDKDGWTPAVEIAMTTPS